MPPDVFRRAPLASGFSWGRVALVATAGLAASAALTRYLAAKAETQHRPLGKFAQLGKTQIHYVDRGSGPPVVVLHGNGSMLEELQSSGLLDQLATTHRVIALDRPGFGLSSRPDATWTPEREAQMLLAFMHQLRIERPVIVAHSWATLTALSLALDEPDSIAGLVLIGGYYYPTTRVDTAVQGLISLPLIGDVLRHSVWPLIARASAPLAFKGVFSPMEPSQKFLDAYSVPMATRPYQLRSFADDTVNMPSAAARLAKRYSELQIPVDLIAGVDDTFVSTTHHSRRLHRELQNSFLDEVPGVGHMAHHAHPKLIERRVAHVLERASTPVATQRAPSRI